MHRITTRLTRSKLPTSFGTLLRSGAVVQHQQQTSTYLLPCDIRNMSILSKVSDTVKNKFQERNEGKQAEAFREQVQTLAYSEKFDLDSFLEQLKKTAEMSGMNGWRSFIPGMSEMAAVIETKANMKIVEAMDPELRRDPKLLTGKAKRLLSEKCGHSPAEINQMLRQYNQLYAMHLWLVKRVERGLPLPNTMEETQEMFREDPTGFPSKMFQVKRRMR